MEGEGEFRGGSGDGAVGECEAAGGGVGYEFRRGDDAYGAVLKVSPDARLCT